MGSDGSCENSPHRQLLVRSSASESSRTILPTVVGILHLAVSLGLVLAADYSLEKAFVAAAIKFPSALFGMFCVFAVLIVLDLVVPAAAMGLMGFFEPATLFIQRWLPLFYVPYLVVLPLSARDVPAASWLKICFIVDFPVLSPCYNVSGVEKVEMPGFSIVFGDGAVWDFLTKNYFIWLEPKEIMCLAILGTPMSSLSIIGNYQQQNFHVLYDTERSRLGFALMRYAEV